MSAGRPLEGKTVVVTRPREQAASLVRPLEAAGAGVLVVPTIRIVPRPLDDEVAAALRDLPSDRLVVFTSANAVRIFFAYLTETGAGPTALAGAAIAAVGPATVAALEERGVSCDVLPDDYVAEGLLEALARSGVVEAGARVLIPNARDARPVLADSLHERGADVRVLPVYDTVAAESLAVPAARLEAADYISFTSSSTATRLAALLEAETSPAPRALAERLAGARLCSIGPVTSETLRALGLTIAVEAAESTSAGLAAAIVADAASG